MTKPATRADLKPGAVFALRERLLGFPAGTRFTLAKDDGSTMPRFRTVCGAEYWLDLDDLTVVAPGANTVTITIPEEVAERFTGADIIMAFEARRAIQDAIREALDASDPKLTEARRLLEGRGYTVTRSVA